MSKPAFYTAVFGGAVAGSETAYQFACRGIKTVVFDQQTLPYGKIEDGLPKWHSKLRDKEEGKINEKLMHPNISYVPNVQLGKDIDFKDLVDNWGFSAVLLATGAWKDRPLPVDGVDAYLNKGFYYQNPFFIWYNHFHEPDFSGQHHDIANGVIVVGGGLASLDVVKAQMIELVQKKLKEKGHDADMFTLDRSIAKVLDNFGYTLDDLGIKPCRLFYRRRAIDMPLSPMATDTPEQLEKAQKVRVKLLNNFITKYLFEFQECHVPVGKIVEGDCLNGLIFQRTEIIDGKAVPIEGSDYEVKSPLVISSIGSVPELIDGIPHEWQTFKISNMETCKIEGFDNVFAVGNAVTGQGNIKESMKHGIELSNRLMDDFFNWKEEDFEEYLRLTESNLEGQVEAISEKFSDKSLLSVDKINEIDDRIKDMQEKVGYDGNYQAWIDKHLPVRLEKMLGVIH